jgi:hypothetical protein
MSLFTNFFEVKIRYFFLLILFCAQTGFSQTKIQVITKTIEKDVPFSAGDILRLAGEKSTIDIKGWTGNYVKIKMLLIAKHPDRSIAERELNFLKYTINKDQNTIHINNYFLSNSIYEDQVKSNLKCQYEILVPVNCLVVISNKYGDVKVSGINSSIELSAELGNIFLSGIKGEMRIKAAYGDIKGENLEGNFFCKAQKSDMNFFNVGGYYKIESSYGKITLTPSSNFKGLDINSSKTEVVFNSKDYPYNYKLSTLFSDIQLPEEYRKSLAKNMAGKSSFELQKTSESPMIRISTSYSPITLNMITF